MSKQSYAIKAAGFVVTDPDSPASVGQRKQIGRLLRFKDHTVEFGNWAIEMIADADFTRGDADYAIKELAECDNVRSIKALDPIKAVKVATKAAESNVSAAEAFLRDSRSGKLGAMCAKRAAAYVA